MGGPGALFTRARDVQTGLPGESEWRGSCLAQQREQRDALCMVGHKRERVLGRVGRAVNAAARDFAREAAQLENGGGREAAAERLVEQQVEVVALDKDRVVVETAMRLDVAVAGLVGEGLAGLPARLAAHV